MDYMKHLQGCYFESLEPWREPHPVPDPVLSRATDDSPDSPGKPSAAAVAFLPRAVPPPYPPTPEELQSDDDNDANDLSTGEGELDHNPDAS